MRVMLSNELRKHIVVQILVLSNARWGSWQITDIINPPQFTQDSRNISVTFPMPVFYWAALVFFVGGFDCLSYFRAPLGVGALTTFRRTSLKKKTTAKPPPKTKRTNKPTPNNQKNPPNSETTATTAARGILVNISYGADILIGLTQFPPLVIISYGADILMGVTQFPTLIRTLAQQNLILSPVRATQTPSPTFPHYSYSVGC